MLPDLEVEGVGSGLGSIGTCSMVIATFGGAHASDCAFSAARGLFQRPKSRFLRFAAE
jgi:hypothetical protein